MPFSTRKRKYLKPQKSKALSTFLIALLSAACFFVPYMISDGGYFTFFGDFNVQQIPFYQMCHAAVKSGEMGWNWLTDLGANFIGSYSFYLLGSPFFWLTIPFPNAVVPYLMGPLLILKFACAALTAYLYLRRFTRTAYAAQLGGLLYAFSGFSIYNIFFNHFHEPLIFFPLLLLSMELLMTERRHGVFALMVAICAITNYFFFFGMVVFCILYFFVRVLTGATKISYARFWLMILEAVLGLLLASFLLLPSILAISGNHRLNELQIGWDAILFGKEQIYLNVIECFFFPPDLPARPVFFPGAEVRWSSLGGWLPVFGLVGVFALFRNQKKNWLKRLLGICFFMAMVPVLNSLFYALNTAYYARWFYMPILMMCLATVWVAEDNTADWMPAWKWVLGITLAFSLVIGLYPQKTEDGTYLLGLYMQESGEKVLHPFSFLPKLGIAVEQTYFFRFWVTVLIAVTGLLVLRWLMHLRKKSRVLFYRIAVAAVCIYAVLFANFFISWGRQHAYDSNMTIDRLIEGSVDLPKTDDYRIDVYEGVDNTGMSLGYPSINAFHSVVPGSIMDFYEYVGETRDVASRPSAENVALRSLLSVKYLLNAPTGPSEQFIDPETNEPAMTGFYYLTTSGGFDVYENENYVPYGYSYQYYMSEDFCDHCYQQDRAAWMTKAILLTDEQIAEYGGTMQDINILYDTYGEDPVGNETTLHINEEALATDSANLRATAATDFHAGKNRFSATVHRDARSLVVFSVPYESGWSATVNGRKVQIEKVNKGFMAVPVGIGDSTITFSYQTPGLSAGFRLSGIALGALLLYLLLAWIIGRKFPPDTAYPEGDELLYRWHNDDLFEQFAGNSEQDLFTDNADFSPPEDKIPGGFTVDPTAFRNDPPDTEKRK